MVTLYVEDDKDGSQSFAVHEHLLCNASPFFKAALEKPSTEEEQRSLSLQDVDANTLNHFVPWLYSGRLSREVGELEPSALYWVAARLNTFALTHELSGLAEEAMALVKSVLDDPRTAAKSNGLPDADQIAEIYRKSPATNPLRKFVIGFFGTQLQPSWYVNGNLTNEYLKRCPEFILDLFVQLGCRTRDLEYSSANLRRSNNLYVQERNKAQQRIEEVENYLEQNYDIDPRDI